MTPAPDRNHDATPPTRVAIRACADWLQTCLELGWRQSDLDALDALWWKYHDHRGQLTAAR